MRIVFYPLIIVPFITDSPEVPRRLSRRRSSAALASPSHIVFYAPGEMLLASFLQREILRGIFIFALSHIKKGACRPDKALYAASGNCGYDGIAIACFSSSSFSTTPGRQASRYRPGCWYRPPQFCADTAHNFAGAGFRQGVGPVQHAGVASGPISLRTQLRTSAYSLVTVPPHD